MTLTGTDLLVVIIAVGVFFLGSFWLASVIAPLDREARERGKRIEFMGMLAGYLSLAFAVVGLIYSIKKIDALEDRVIALEQSATEPER